MILSCCGANIPVLGDARFRRTQPVGRAQETCLLNPHSGDPCWHTDAGDLSKEDPFVAQSAKSASGVAERYASALFDLALTEKKLSSTEGDLGRFGALLDGSDDLMRLVRSPAFTADDQLKAVGAVLDKAKIDGLVGNFIRVVTANRRLFVMPGILSSFTDLMAAHRGEVAADVTVAQALTAAQTKTLKAALKSVVGKDVAFNATVDPSILGGMIVKVGSRQIDTSLKTKLSSLKLALKEVG